MKEQKMFLVVLSVVITILTISVFSIQKITKNLREKRELFYVLYWEELDLYMGRVNDYTYTTRSITTVFSHNLDSLYSMDNSNSKRGKFLNFCRIDSTIVLAVREGEEYQSFDIPVVTFDKELNFDWGGGRFWLMDFPLFHAEYNSDSHEWGVFEYDPRRDDWYDALVGFQLSDFRYEYKMMMNHPNSRFYVQFAGGDPYLTPMDTHRRDEKRLMQDTLRVRGFHGTTLPRVR